MSKNTQVGIRIPNELYARLESERLQAVERGEKVTMTEIIVKYLYRGIGDVSDRREEDIPTPILERLTVAIEKLEAKL